MPESGRTPSLDIVCVEWRSGPLLEACLRSIARSDLTSIEIRRAVVVDNSETPPRSLTISGLPLSWMANLRNVGFGAACNQGARDSEADYLLFLNPDIRLERHALAKLVAAIESDPHVGIAGPRLVDADGHTTRSCARRPTFARMLAQAAGMDRLPGFASLRHFMDDWDHTQDRDVFQIMGACLMIRRLAFEALGGFDERFFLYYEDVDLCARAWGSGWRCRFYAEPVAMHGGGGTTSQIKARRAFYNACSRVLYARKHFGAAAAAAMWTVLLSIEPVARTLRAVFIARFADIPDIWRAAAMLAAATPSLLSGSPATRVP